MLVIEDLVPERLWEQVAPLLPAPKPRPYRHHGRRPADDRAALAGIVFVPRYEVGWVHVPRAALGVSGVTCWRRYGSGPTPACGRALHEALLAQMRSQGLPDLDEMSVDGSHVRALKRGDNVGPSPVDRGRPRSKHHLIVDAHGTPLQVTLTWLHQFKRVRTRYERRADLHLGLLHLACAIICWRKLPTRSF